MSLPIHKRDFDFFLSHAHKDRQFVESLYVWLKDIAGFRVWYDAKEMSGGALLATDLQQAIERCRGTLLVASNPALAQGWVKAEYNSSMDERANNPDFRVVALRIAGANTKELMKGTTWIDVPGPDLDGNTALAIVRSCYPKERWPEPSVARDVYVSCSWRSEDSASARATCRALVEQGFRLIGDARDQKGFGSGDRVERIIASCGALVSIIPFREEALARTDGGPYKYMLREIDTAAGLGIPTLVIADPRVRRDGGSDAAWLRMETAASECPATVASALEGLSEDWQPPPRPQYVFLALDLDGPAAQPSGDVRELIERITGMPTIVGNEIHESNIQSAIIEKIARAFVVVADITDDNLNTCIEAGIALAAGANLELVSAGKPRRPPFMLRSVQMPTYENECQHIGMLRRLLHKYRRRVINAEL